MLHIFISAADERHPARLDRRGRARLPRDDPGRDGTEVPDGEPGRLAVQGPTGCRYLDERQRRTCSTAGTSPATPTPRRRRLLLVPGAQRRHDHLRRLQHRRARGRGGAARAPGLVAECAVIGVPDRGAACIVKAYVVLREAPGRTARRSRAAGLRQGRDRARTSTPCDRVRRRAAQDRRPGSCSDSGSGRWRGRNFRPVRGRNSGPTDVDPTCHWPHWHGRWH